MVLSDENCPEKRMEAGEDTEPMVAKEPKAEVAKVKAEELEVIVEDPTSPTSTVKTKVRIKVLTGLLCLLSSVGVALSDEFFGGQEATVLFFPTPQLSSQ